MPSDSDYETQPTDRHKCRAERVPFSHCGEGSRSVPSSVKKLKFKKQDGLRSSGAERSGAECDGAVLIALASYIHSSSVAKVQRDKTNIFPFSDFPIFWHLILAESGGGLSRP